MALSSDSSPPIDRTQSRSIETDIVATPAMDESDAIVEGQTVYVSFDVMNHGVNGLPESVQALLENDTHSTAIRQVPSAVPASNADAELVQTQALELAAQRAEISRLERELDEVQRALRLREGWLGDLRKELKAAQDEKRTLSAQLADTKRLLADMTARVEKQAAQIATLEAQAEERMSVTAFAADAPRTRPAAKAEPLNSENPATLLPLDDNSAPIVLDRKVMTIGRTRDNDICVPSVLVSRDHARMLVSDDSVVLFDVGSINGSFVNEQVVKRHVLRDGDIVRFADRRYRFCG
jgi:hypothetical protein